MFIGLEHAPPEFDVRNKILGSEVNTIFTAYCIFSFLLQFL